MTDNFQETLAYRTEGLTKIYGGGNTEVRALNGIDMTVRQGEFMVLLGPSGSGKSTLLNIMGGLDRASGGHVYFHDRDITHLDDRELTRYRRDEIGFVFQFFNLMPGLTARENVALVSEIASDAMTPDDALALVGLDHRLDHFPPELSGGEQQRVAIARALAKKPTVLFCDEPTGALDRATGILVLEALEVANKELGTTILTVTHNAGIAGMAHRVVYFSDGQIHKIVDNDTRLSPDSVEW